MKKPYIKLNIPEIRIIERKEDGNVIAGKVVNFDNGGLFKVPVATLTMRYTYLDKHSEKISVFDEDIHFDGVRSDEELEDGANIYTFYKSHDLSEDVCGIIMEVFDPRDMTNALSHTLLFVYDQETHKTIKEKLNSGIFKTDDNEDVDCFSVFVLLCAIFGWFDKDSVLGMLEREKKGENVKAPKEPFFSARYDPDKHRRGRG